MERNTSIALAVLGLTAVCGLFFVADLPDGKRHGPGSGAQDSAASPGNLSRRVLRPEAQHPFSPGVAETAAPSGPGLSIRPHVAGLSGLRQNAVDSDPAARRTLDEGLGLLQAGDYGEARTTFWRLITTTGEKCAFSAPAYWSLGLAYYKEGSLELAAEYFANFPLAFRECGLKDLAQAAQINAAVIRIQLMRASPGSGDSIRHAREAVTGLRAFLDIWPDDPLVPEVHAALATIRHSVGDPESLVSNTVAR